MSFIAAELHRNVVRALDQQFQLLRLRAARSHVAAVAYQRVYFIVHRNYLKLAGLDF